MIEDELRERVFTRISSYLPKGTAVSAELALVDDLHLLSDDQSFIAIGLEKELGIRVPRNEWRRVSTVQDVIDTLWRHLK